MKAIILADRLGKELHPLSDRTCVALLHVACKPVIQYTIEDLADAGITEILIATSAFGDQIRECLGDGARWGLQIDYLPTRGEEKPSDILHRIGAACGEELLIVRGDTLRSRTIARFLVQARQSKVDVIVGQLEPTCTSILLLRGPDPEVDRLHWPPVTVVPGRRLETLRRTIVLKEFQSSALDTYAEFLSANLMAADGQYPGLSIVGMQKAPGLICGRGSRMPPDLLPSSARVIVGSGTTISSRASLRGRVVISDNVVIDRDTAIENSVILPDTFVGQAMVLKNTIAFGSYIIDVVTGEVRAENRRLRMANLNEISPAGLLTCVVNRALGLLLLIGSLPLWPAAVIASALSNDKAILRHIRLRSDRVRRTGGIARRSGVVSALQFSTSIPVLRDLPMLWAVVRCDLRVVGIRKPEVRRDRFAVTDTEKLIEDAPCGMIGPAQLSLSSSTPPTEKILSEAYYARTRSPATDLRYLLVGLRMLFSKRAWTPPRTEPAQRGERSGSTPRQTMPDAETVRTRKSRPR